MKKKSFNKDKKKLEALQTRSSGKRNIPVPSKNKNSQNVNPRSNKNINSNTNSHSKKNTRPSAFRAINKDRNTSGKLKKITSFEREELKVMREEYEELRFEISELEEMVQYIDEEISELEKSAGLEIKIWRRRVEYLTKKIYGANLEAKSEVAPEISEVSEESEQLTPLQMKEDIKQIGSNNIETVKTDLQIKYMKEINESKNRALNDIRFIEDRNDKQLDELRNFYTKTTSEHLYHLQQKLTELAKVKMRFKDIQKQVNQGEKTKEKLEKEILFLTNDSESINSDIKEIAENKKKIETLKEDRDNMKIADEILTKRLKQLEEERNALYDQFESSIKDVRQKAEFREIIIQQKIKSLNQKLDNQDV